MNWVSNQLGWTPQKALAELKKRITEDVSIWKGLVGDAEAGFVFLQEDSYQLSVERKAIFGGNVKWAAIAQRGTEITIRRDDEPDSKVIESVLGDKGEELFRFEEMEMELWQMSRHVLRPILFFKR